MKGQGGQHNFIGSTPTERCYVSASQALKILNAAQQKSLDIQVPVNIAVVDPSGLLVSFLRVDNAFPGSIDISIKKARTVGLFSGALDTAQLYAAVQPGAPLYGIEATNSGLIAFGGGLPLFVDGHFIGAIGCSGALTPDDDVAIATAGAEAIGASISFSS